MHLSVVIPAYNEAPRIEKTLAAVRDYLARQTYEAEIVVVDDGSTDGTAAVVEAAFPSVRLIAYEPNHGKGHAVCTGMLAALGAYRLYYDADGSTPIGELEKVWSRFAAGADVVIGSRALPESQILVAQTWWRRAMGRGFNFLVRFLLFQDIADTQCGFKAFTAEAAKTVFSRQTVEGFAFDAELLYIARKRGLGIEQVPIRWANSPKSAVGLTTAPIQMIQELFRIRANNRQGRYD